MNTANLQMPRTKTPAGVIWGLIGMFALAGILLYLLIGVWGAFALGILVGLAVWTGAIAEEVPAFQALIMLNAFTGQQRTIFQGLHSKLPWESSQQNRGGAKYVDLRVDVHEACKEKYPSLDALMETTYVYTLRPDLSGDAGTQLITYSSYSTDTVQRSGRAVISMLLSDYFGKKRGEDLLDKGSIGREVFDRDPGATLIADFQRQHGVVMSVQLESSAFDDATQSYRSMVAGADSFTEAVQRLVSGGIARSDAEVIAKMMNLKGAKEYFITLGTR
ncbi:hypothetical protein BH10ACI3_BH10ACI3_27920 [soil metagenome]